MEPAALDAAGWAMVGALVTKLAVFMVLVILGAFCMLLSRAVLPSLIATHQIADQLVGRRRLLTATGTVAFVLAIVQLVRIVFDSATLLSQFYPRFGF